jgi:hypothetical protein
MNSTMYAPTDTMLDREFFKQINEETRNMYATEPMPAIKKLAYQQPDEEELHTSFEEAISDRLLALHSRLDRLSNPTLVIQGAERNTDPVLSTTTSIRNATTSRKFAPIAATSNHVEDVSHFAWKRMTIFACSAAMFLLLGFDLMGLLVLHIH